VELHFSPGAYYCGENKNKDPNSLGYRSQMSEKQAREKEEERKAIKEEAMKHVPTFPTSLDAAGVEPTLTDPLGNPVTETLKDSIKESMETLNCSSDNIQIIPRLRLGSTPSELELRKQTMKANALRVLDSQNRIAEDLDTQARIPGTMPFCDSYGFVPNKSVPSTESMEQSMSRSGHSSDSMDSKTMTGKSPGNSDSESKMVSFSSSTIMADIPERPEDKGNVSFGHFAVSLNEYLALSRCTLKFYFVSSERYPLNLS
jgi:hypothetical protein